MKSVQSGPHAPEYSAQILRTQCPPGLPYTLWQSPCLPRWVFRYPEPAMGTPSQFHKNDRAGDTAEAYGKRIAEVTAQFIRGRNQG